MRTWSDLEERALTDPFLHRMMHLVREGVPREQALIDVVYALSNARIALLDDNLRLIERSRHLVFVPKS